MSVTAIVGQNQVAAWGNEQPPFEIDAVRFKLAQLFHQTRQVNHDPRPDNADRLLVKNAAGYEV